MGLGSGTPPNPAPATTCSSTGTFTSTAGVGYICSGSTIKVNTNGGRCYGSSYTSLGSTKTSCATGDNNADNCTYTTCAGACIPDGGPTAQGHCCKNIEQATSGSIILDGSVLSGTTGEARVDQGGEKYWWYGVTSGTGTCGSTGTTCDCCLARNSQKASTDSCCSPLVATSGSYCCSSGEVWGGTFDGTGLLSASVPLPCFLSYDPTSKVITLSGCSSGRSLGFKPQNVCGNPTIVYNGRCVSKSVITSKTGFMDFSACSGNYADNCTGGVCCDAVCRTGCSSAGIGYYVRGNDNTCPASLMCASNNQCITKNGADAVVCDTAGATGTVSASSSSYGRTYYSSSFRHCITCNTTGRKVNTTDYPSGTSYTGQCSVACGADADCAFISPTVNYGSGADYICDSNCTSNMMDIYLHYVDIKPYLEHTESSLNKILFDKLRSSPGSIDPLSDYGASYIYDGTSGADTNPGYEDWVEDSGKDLPACSVYGTALKLRSNAPGGLPNCASGCTLEVIIEAGANMRYRNYTVYDSDFVTSGGYKYIVSGVFNGGNNNPNDPLESKEAVKGNKTAILTPLPKSYFGTGIVKFKYKLIQSSGSNIVRIWTGMFSLNPSASQTNFIGDLCDTNYNRVPSEYLSQPADSSQHYHFCDPDKPASGVDGACSYMDAFGQQQATPCDFNLFYTCDTSFRDKTTSTYSTTYSTYSSYADEPPFCNLACSCSGSTPRCGTCDSFESPQSCPTDCCDWTCGDYYELGTCSGSVSTDLRDLIQMESRKYYTSSSSDDNNVCHVAVPPNTASSTWRDWKCSVFCGADPRCGDPYNPSKPGENMCSQACMSTCSDFSTTYDDIKEFNIEDLEDANRKSIQYPLYELFYDYNGGSTNKMYITPEDDFIDFLQDHQYDGDGDVFACDNATLGEDAGQCPIDCCKVDGCMSSYSPGYEDCAGGGITGWGIVRGTGLDNKCRTPCSMTRIPDLRCADGKTPGSAECTVDCLKRYHADPNLDPRYSMEVSLFNTPSDCRSWNKPVDENNVPACGMRYVGIKVPYNLYCGQVPPLQGGNDPVGNCILNFTSNKYLPVRFGQDEVNVPAGSSTNVTFTIGAGDITYLPMLADVNGDNNANEEKYYAIICSVENGQSPIAFPPGDPLAAVNFNLFVNLTAYTETGDKTWYSGSRSLTTQTKLSGCEPGTYCRQSILPTSTMKYGCVGTEMKCPNSYYRCLNPDIYGRVDARIFTPELELTGADPPKIYCCDPPSGSYVCSIKTNTPEVLTYYQSCHAGTSTPTPAGDLGMETGSVPYYCTTGTKECNSFFHGYTPPSSVRPDSRVPPVLKPCREYQVGLDLDGGKEFLFEPKNFTEAGKGPWCSGNDCLVEFEIGTGNKFLYRLSAAASGLAKGSYKQFLYQGERVLEGNPQQLDIKNPPSNWNLGVNDVFALFTTGLRANTQRDNFFFINVSGKNTSNAGVDAYGNTYYITNPGSVDRLCDAGEPCLARSDCMTTSGLCGGSRPNDTKEMYCDYSINSGRYYPSCKCVCNGNLRCDFDRAEFKESTSNCPTDCCVGTSGVSVPALGDGTKGICTLNCGNIDSSCHNKFPGTNMCGDGTSSAAGGYTLCRNSCGISDLICHNGQKGKDYGESPSTCTSDCCARVTPVGGAETVTGYTLNFTGGSADLLCDRACINATQLGWTQEQKDNSMVYCGSKKPGFGGCDKNCMFTNEATYLKPVLFSDYNKYRTACTTSPTVQVFTATPNPAVDPTSLLACTKYYIAFLVDSKDNVNCGSDGCDLSIDQSEGLSNKFNIKSEDLVCIERAKQTFQNHKFSKQNVVALITGGNYEDPGDNYCTQWAICPSNAPYIILPSVKTETAVSSYFNYSLAISPYSSIEMNKSYTYRPISTGKYYCPANSFGVPASQGTYCLSDNDCERVGPGKKIVCELSDHTCRNYCGDGICQPFETTDPNSGCGADCCVSKPLSSSYAGYNKTGLCDINCGSHQSCHGRLPNSDIILNMDKTACDEFCILGEDSIVLYTKIKPCPKDLGVESCGTAGDISGGGRTEIIYGQSDLYLGFNLAEVRHTTGRIGNFSEDISSLNVTIIAGPFRQEHLSLSAGGSYIRTSDWPVGIYNVSVIASHPKLIDAVTDFTIHVKKLQDVKITVATSNGGQNMGTIAGFYRLRRGISSDYGLDQAWFKVDSVEINATQQVSGIATCDYGPYHLVGRTGEWVNMSVYNIPAAYGKLECTVRADNYFDGTNFRYVVVKGLITSADAEIPPELTPDVPARMRVSKILDELVPPSEVTDADITWLISNYPSKGLSNSFCTYKGVESDCTLYSGVPVGNQTLTLQIDKKISSIKIYDTYERFIPVKINPSSKYSLSLGPRSKIVSTKGGSARFIASVFNEGNMAVVLNMSLQANQSVMNMTAFRLAELQVFPGLVKDQQILFNIPAGPEANYTFNITAIDISKNVSQSLEGNITVTTQTVRQVSLSSPRNLTILLGANETLDTDLVLSNDGNVDDQYKLSLFGSGANVASLNATEVSVDAGGVSSVRLNIKGEIGIHEFRVCATSKQDSKISSCVNALIKVFKESVDIVVPDKLNLTQGEKSKITIKLRGFGSGLLIVTADSYVNQWLNWTSLEVEIPGDYDLGITPTMKGNYTLVFDLVTTSDRKYSKNMTIFVNPPEIEILLRDRARVIAEQLTEIDTKLQRLKEAGVEAVMVQSLMEQIAKKRAEIDKLLEEGKYDEAKALMVELEDLLSKVEEYSKLPVKIAALKPQLNLGTLVLGLVALSIGLGGLYFVFSRGPKTWLPPKV